MLRDTRPISWLKGARKDFDDFPLGAQIDMARALTVLAEGQMPDIAKPLAGFGSGVMELALKHRGDAFRWSTRFKLPPTYGWCMHSEEIEIRDQDAKRGR